MKNTKIIPRQYIFSSTCSPVFCEHFLYEEKTVIENHSHEFPEIGITLEGSASHRIGKQKAALKKGSVYLIPTGISHAIAADAGWNIFNIYLLPALFTAHFSQQKNVSWHVLNSFLMRLCGNLPDVISFELSEQTMHLLNLTTEQLENHPFMSAPSYHAFRENCILNLLLLLAEEFQTRTGISCTFSDPRIPEMNACIQEYLELPLHELLDELARHLSLSPASVNRLMKQCFGIPVSRYILRCKMERAILLLHAGTSVTETACILGFYDHSHFHKSFVQYAGISPAEFRKRALSPE